MNFEMKFEFGQRQKKTAEKKSDLVQYQGGNYFLGLASISPARLRDYIEAYKISEVVRACIDKINLAAKSVPWYLYQRKGKDVIEVAAHPLLDVLKRPSKSLRWPKFLEQALGYYLISGNRYIRKYLGSFRRYAELEVLMPQKVYIKTNQAGEVAAYEYYKRGVKLPPILPEEIFHSKMFNPGDDLYGLSPITTIAPQIDISRFATEWTIKLLLHDARPSAIAFIPGNLTEEQRQAIKQQWKEDYAGPDNVGGLLILEGGAGSNRPGDLKLTQLGPRELELSGSDPIITRKICSVYHVPSELLGDAQNKTYSNQKEARKALYQEATLPHLDELFNDLNDWLVPDFEGAEDMFFAYDVSDIDALAADTNEVWERAGKAVDRGIIHRNEAREVYGYGESKEPGMDKPTVPGNVMPIEVVAGGGTGE
jgi:HK97 family phage portal protein